MFGRKNKDADEALAGNHELDAASSAIEATAQSRQKKGPTPTRKQAQRRNYRPVVSSGATMSKTEKREMRQQLRQKQDEEWRLEQEAMRTGDERHMPARYKGVERRFARDYVDARFNIATAFFPMALLFIMSGFFQKYAPPIVLWVTTIAFYVIFALMGVDAWIAGRNARTLVAYKFGEKRVPHRLVWDMLTRVFFPGRFRRPWPQTKRGQYPEGGTPADLRKAKKAKKTK